MSVDLAVVAAVAARAHAAVRESEVEARGREQAQVGSDATLVELEVAGVP